MVEAVNIKSVRWMGGNRRVSGGEGRERDRKNVCLKRGRVGLRL